MGSILRGGNEACPGFYLSWLTDNFFENSMYSFVSLSQGEFEVQQISIQLATTLQQVIHLEVTTMSEWFGNEKGDAPAMKEEDSMEFVPGFGIHGEKGSIKRMALRCLWYQTAWLLHHRRCYIQQKMSASNDLVVDQYVKEFRACFDTLAFSLVVCNCVVRNSSGMNSSGLVVLERKGKTNYYIMLNCAISNIKG